MKKSLYLFIALMLMFTMVLGACGGSNNNEPVADNAPAENAPADNAPADDVVEEVVEEPKADDVTLTVGFTKSISGKYETSSGKQFKGFELWLAAINDAGGIQLSDGSSVTFDTVFYDDESNADRVQELYTRLATEDNASFLISPYSSGLTKSAAIIAEQYEKVMLAAGAASDSIFQQGYTQTYQIYTPASRYLAGAVDLLVSLNPDVDKVAIVYENNQFAIDVATVTKSLAESLGIEVTLFEGYDSETADFGPFINKIESSGSTYVLGGGHFQDGSTFARQVHDLDANVEFFAMVVAPPEPDFAELGDAAVGVIGPSHWEPKANITMASNEGSGLAWIGPDGDAFVTAYSAAYDGEEPSYHSAGGYAAGLVLEQAIRAADSTDPAAVRAALESMDLMTFWGSVRFDTTEESHGLQVGHSSMYIQWQRDASGELVKEVVWPAGGATAPALFPIP